MPALRLPALFLLASGLVAQADQPLGMPSVFSDHMVLQSGARVPVWGWASPGTRVTVAIAGRQAQAVTDGEGRWRADLDDLQVGGPHEMVVTGGATIRIADVLVGEVWLASGQSNMAMTVSRSQNAEQERAAADFPKIRMFTVKPSPKPVAQRDCQGSWVVCSPQSVPAFSATAYFFGRRLHQTLQVPVGLLNSSVGGTPIEAWTSMRAQREEPRLADMLQRWDKRDKNWRPVTNAQFQATLQKWQVRVEAAKAKNKRTPRKPRRPANPKLNTGHPANLFRGMIHPLIPYRIQGALWYQGERNAKTIPSAQMYAFQLPMMIADWRARWGQGDFPFAFVQLPNYHKRKDDPNATSAWAVMRESMAKTLSVANTGMATTIDVGMARDIHPKNKQAVGSRLAQWALAKVYRQAIPASGPVFAKAEYRDGSAFVSFEADGEDLTVLDGPTLKGFAIAGEDRVFKFAEAKIEGGQVRVWHPSVPDPVAVRYAFGDNPECNLANAAKLPAAPFRSDSWELK